MKAPRLPGPLKLVILFFLLIGILGVAHTIGYAFQGSFMLSPWVIALFIGGGLRKLHPGWRIIALVSLLFALFLTVMVVNILFFSDEVFLFFVPPSMFPLLVPLGCLAALWACAIIGSLWILMRRQIVQLFHDPDTGKLASALRVGSFVLLILCISRLSGGIEGSWSSTRSKFQQSGFSSPVTLAELEPAAPLPIEVRGKESTSWIFLTWIQTRKLPDPAILERSTQHRFMRFNGGWVKDQASSHPNRIVATIEKIELTGDYWRPWHKVGSWSAEVKIAGQGKYSRYFHHHTIKAQFDCHGLRTVNHLRQSIRKTLDKLIRAVVLKAATQSRQSGNLERVGRRWPLNVAEIGNLADDYRQRAQRYYRAGNYQDGRALLLQGVRLREQSAQVPSKYRSWNAQIQRDRAQAYAEVIWALSTWPDKEGRDGEQALILAKRAMMKLAKGRVSLSPEIYAAAFAEVGDFEKAIQWQKKALQGGKLNDNLAEARLKLYESGKPFRESRQK